MPTPTPGPRASYALGTRSLLLLVPVDDTQGQRVPADSDPYPRAHALAAALSDSQESGSSRCRLLLPGRHDDHRITDAITESARTVSTLIVYVTGQLDVDATDRLTLAGPRVETGPGPGHPRPALPGLPWSALATTIGRASSPARLLLADLHATTSAWQRLHRPHGSAYSLLKPAATALLGHITPPFDPDGTGAFTDLLTALLRRGDPTGPAALTIGHLASRLRAIWPRGASPRLTVFDPDTAHISFRNPAATGLLHRRLGPGTHPVGGHTRMHPRAQALIPSL